MKEVAAGLIIGLVTVLFIDKFTKPECKEGFVASYSYNSWWICIPGYKP